MSANKKNMDPGGKSTATTDKGSATVTQSTMVSASRTQALSGNTTTGVSAGEHSDPGESFFPRKEDGKGSQKIDLQILPARLGRYLLVEELGAGSVGVVYQGLDRHTDQEVAVKVMQDQSVQFSDADNSDWVRQRRKFFDEARACGRMRHRNILKIVDMGIERGLCFIATELVPGATTLGDFLASRGKLSCRQVATVLHRCAGVLDHIHQRQVIHRDVKPENILLPKDHDLGNIRLTDFGIAHMAHSNDGSEEILGSPRYMSPEQIQGIALGPASDFFSLGVICYELLTGRHPFRASNMRELCQKIISGKPEALADINPDITPGLLDIINGCMAKDPAKRVADGRHIVKTLVAEYPNLGDYDGGETGDTRLTKAMWGVPFFSEFAHDELEQIADICLVDEYSPGAEIIEQDTVNDSFFVILEGDVLIQHNSTDLGRLTAGGCFGEMGYLTSIKRTATVLAVRKTTVIKFNVDMVSQLPMTIQLKFSRSFIRLLVTRLADTTKQLAAT